MRNLVERRGLLAGLVQRDFETRYKGSVAGWLWGVIHPLVLLLVYTFVFSVVLGQTPGPGEVTQNYPLFLFAGMLPWLLFNETVTRSTTSLLEQSTLITKTVFPSEVVPVAIFLSSLVSHLMAVALAVAGALIVLHTLSLALLALPLMILLLGLFAIGLVGDGQPSGVSAGYRAGIDGCADAVVLGDADLHLGQTLSRAVAIPD